MKNLKNSLVIYICLLFVLALCLGCGGAGPKPKVEHRIILKEYSVLDGRRYQIIEIDGIEYISTSAGGICPLVNDINQ